MSDKIISNLFNTSSIEYEYTIISQLYEKKQIYNAILNQIHSIIVDQINLLYNYYTNENEVSIPEIDKIKKVTTILFKNIPFETGQIGNDIYIYDYTQGKKTKTQTTIKNKSDIINVTKKFNIRESMTVIKNFHRGNNNCFMYKMLLIYKSAIETNTVESFIKKYPMLNIQTLKESITFIENILGIDMSLTKHHYNIEKKDNKLKILDKVERQSRQTLPLYEFIQQNNNYNNPVTLCYLWHPLSVQIPYQILTKMSVNNTVNDLVNSFKSIDNNNIDNAKTCTSEIVKKYPPIPPLSTNELNYLNKSSNNNDQINKNDWVNNIKWKPSICYHTEIIPTSFVLQQLKNANKLSISNYSGHTSLLLMISSYFNNVNYELLILANMLWTVPYNHSINEVFMGAKMMNVYTEYNYKLSSFENVNTILLKNSLPTLDEKINWDGKIYYYKLQGKINLPKKISKGGKKTKKLIRWKNISPSKKTLRQYKKKYGKQCFLLPSQNKYPICNKYSGKVSCKGLLAAHNRAMLSVYRKLKPKTYSYKKIANTARKTAKINKCKWVK